MPRRDPPANAFDIEADIWSSVQDRSEAFACRWSDRRCTAVPPQLQAHLTPDEFETTMRAINAAIVKHVGTSECCAAAGASPTPKSQCLCCLAVALLPVAFSGYLIIECQLRWMAERVRKEVLEALTTSTWRAKGIGLQWLPGRTGGRGIEPYRSVLRVTLPGPDPAAPIPVVGGQLVSATVGAPQPQSMSTTREGEGNKFCTNCGTPLPRAANFCSKCGQAQ